MPANYMSKLVLPVYDSTTQTTVNTEFTLKDAEARQMIEDLGHALYWAGVTTTALTDGSTTNPIVINGEDVTVNLGAVASYDGLEFVFNGTSWQAFGHANFGALAFKSSASGDYTPSGSVTITEAADTTASVIPFGSAGSLPAATWSVSGETATFSFDAGALPTAGTAVDVVTQSGARTASFAGTAATITVE
jgi:hypothetical protein